MPSNRAQRRKRVKEIIGWRGRYTKMLVTDKSTWKWFEHPHEPGVKFRLRPLTDDEYQQALDARFDQVIDKAKNLGGELTKTLQSAPGAQASANPMASIHASTAIKIALVEWSYDAPLEEAVNLDKNTQDWLKEVIVEMNGPLPTRQRPLGDSKLPTDSSPVSSPEPTGSGLPESALA